jgi:plastocyanin
MSSGKNTALVIAVLIVVLLSGAIVIKKSHRFTTLDVSSQNDTTSSTSPEALIESSRSASSTNETVVTLNSSGFSPMTVTIKAGDTISWTNTDSTPHTVNSNPHPTHTDYPPLNQVGEINPGETKSFTFTSTGTYKYHDHLFPENGGVVIVK